MQATMQATVATYDEQTRSGTVLRDDGSRLAYDTAAFDAGGLHRLRLGQRVNIAVGDGTIACITLSTFPLP